MTDNYPNVPLGTLLDEAQTETILTAPWGPSEVNPSIRDRRASTVLKYVCASSVTKGQLVSWAADVAGKLPTVQTAGAVATNVVGVALDNGSTGSLIRVAVEGIAKVTASTAISANTLVVAAASGQIQAVGANTFEKVIGRALQAFGAGDTGLVMISL